MKLQMLCKILIAMLLISPAALGEILSTGTGTSVSASATASDSTPYEEDDDTKWKYVYTTEAGTFTYHCEAGAYAWGTVVVEDGWARAIALAEAETTCKYYTAYNFADVDLSSTDFDWDHPPDDIKEDSGDFNAYEGVSAECRTDCVAGIEEGSLSSAGCNSYAIAVPGLG